MFSVIIPVFNKAPYLQKAIYSVISQTFQEFELIVVNDGSKDNSLEVLQSINKTLDKPFTIINQQNAGVSTARNNGVKIAQYEYIAFLDADDWWDATYLEEMKALITQYPEAGIYGSSYFKVKNGKHIPANIGVEAGFQHGFINYFKVYAKTMWMPLTSISAVIKKDIFIENNGFKPALKLGEDFDLWVRIAIDYPVAFVNKALAYYNQDVDVINRAVNSRFYKPHEHMLFSDYGDIMNHKDFRYLYEKLALYGLLPYFLFNINKKEVKRVLNSIDWKKHSVKYKIIYNFMPKFMMKTYIKVVKFGYQIKQVIHERI